MLTGDCGRGRLKFVFELGPGTSGHLGCVLAGDKRDGVRAVDALHGTMPPDVRSRARGRARHGNAGRASRRRARPDVATDRTMTPGVLGQEGEPHDVGVDLQQTDAVPRPIQFGWHQKAAAAQKVEHLHHDLLVGSADRRSA